MAQKKSTTPIRPSPRAAKASRELRARTNHLSDAERESLFNHGMQLIYGGGNTRKAVAGSR